MHRETEGEEEARTSERRVLVDMIKEGSLLHSSDLFERENQTPDDKDSKL